MKRTTLPPFLPLSRPATANAEAIVKSRAPSPTTTTDDRLDLRPNLRILGQPARRAALASAKAEARTC